MNSNIFRENAANCLYLAESAQKDVLQSYRRMADAWTALADEQDWLDLQSSGRATELAGGAIDRMRDKGASNIDVKDRKRQLIEGPEEFRNVRVDQDNKRV